MPKLIFPEEFETQIADDIRIGYREQGKHPKWYARIYWENGEKNSYYSLGVKYEEGMKSFLEARDAAHLKYADFKERVTTGGSPTTIISVESMGRRYLKQIRAWAEANEALIAKGQLPRHKDDRNGFWTIKKVESKERYHRQVEPFFDTKWNKSIRNIDLRFLDTFLQWALDNREWAPSTINYHITYLKQVWTHSYNKGFVDNVPKFTRASADLKNRSFRALQAEEWDMMIEWAAKRFHSKREKATDPEAIDLAYQYWMWLHFLSYTGVRPPHGQVKKNLLKWESYIVEERDTPQEKRMFKRTDEKEHDYEAVIMPEAWDVFNMMEEFREKRGLAKTYLFQHTYDKENSWKKGDPILNFRSTWRNMLRDLGLAMPKGSPAHETLVPYALRGYFITMRLRDGGMRIEDLAEATGTSVPVIREIYYEFSTRKQYSDLTSGSHPDRVKVRERDKDGFASI
jgi:integrase